jgi:hypothetical protein
MPDTPQVAQARLDHLDKMREETDAILAESAALLARVEGLLEEARQLHLTNAALIEQRKRNKP